MSESLDRYRELRHTSHMVYLPEDDFPYELSNGEMNPVLFGGFFADFENGKRIFEPFSNPDGRTFEAAEAFDHQLVAHGLIAHHPKILIADSTQHEPGGLFDGVLFHPPYYGSRSFTPNEKDLSNASNVHDYRRWLECAASIAMLHLKDDGLVFAVGRRYRYEGQEIKLDEWLVYAFGNRMIPVQVIMSEPDIAIIFEFMEKEKRNGR